MWLYLVSYIAFCFINDRLVEVEEAGFGIQLIMVRALDDFAGTY